MLGENNEVVIILPVIISAPFRFLMRLDSVPFQPSHFTDHFGFIPDTHLNFFPFHQFFFFLTILFDMNFSQSPLWTVSLWYLPFGCW